MHYKPTKYIKAVGKQGRLSLESHLEVVVQGAKVQRASVAVVAFDAVLNKMAQGERPSTAGDTHWLSTWQEKSSQDTVPGPNLQVMAREHFLLQGFGNVIPAPARWLVVTQLVLVLRRARQPCGGFVAVPRK